MKSNMILLFLDLCVAESAPHVHIRLEGQELSDYEEFIRKFEHIIRIIPKIEKVMK